MKAHVPAVEAEKVLAKALFRAGELFGFSDAALAGVLGVHASTVSRARQKGALDPKSNEGERALLFLRIVRSLDAVVGGHEKKARAWLDAPNEHLGGAPRERLNSITGLVHVADYLDATRGVL